MWDHGKLDRILHYVGEIHVHLSTLGKIIMTTAQQVTDLTAAVGVLAGNFTTLTSNIATNDTAVQAELVALKAAIAAVAPPAVSDPAVQASIDNISSLSKSAAAAAAAIATETANLTASIAPTDGHD